MRCTVISHFIHRHCGTKIVATLQTLEATEWTWVTNNNSRQNITAVCTCTQTHKRSYVSHCDMLFSTGIFRRLTLTSFKHLFIYFFEQLPQTRSNESHLLLPLSISTLLCSVQEFLSPDLPSALSVFHTLLMSPLFKSHSRKTTNFPGMHYSFDNSSGCLVTVI